MTLHEAMPLRPVIAAFSLFLGVGCGSDAGAGAGATDGPLYAMMIQVYDDTDRTVYVPLSSSLELEPNALDEAREFPGVANFAAVDGRLLISDGNEPTITEFEISDDLDWIEGRNVSFLDYPLGDNANFYYQFIVDEHTALLPFETTKRIVWDPAEMAITGTLEDSNLVASEGALTLEAGGNRNSVAYDAEVIQAFFYHDDDWFDYGTKSHLVVYDADTLEESEILDVPCPGLTIATRDEQGNTYFSNWGLPMTSVMGDAPPTCVAKVGADSTLEETIDLREWTEGRYVSNFRYLGNGKAFGNVLHHEELGVADPGELAAEDIELLWASGPHWRMWLFDLETETASPVEGIEVDIADGAQFAKLDGRTFVFLPYDDWGRSKIYELSDDGTATEFYDTVGDIYQWVRVR